MIAPLPWSIDRNTVSEMWTDSISIKDARGGHVAHLTRGYEGGDDGSGSPSWANAELIVRAVNAEGMWRTIGDTLEWLRNYLENLDDYPEPREAIERVEAAISALKRQSGEG